MKKLAALLLALVMVLALAACAGTPAEKPTDTKAPATEAPATEKNADTTAPATEPAGTEPVESTAPKGEAGGVDLSQYPAKLGDWTAQNFNDYFTALGIYDTPDYIYLQDHTNYYASLPVNECGGYMDDGGLYMTGVFTMKSDDTEGSVEEFLNAVREKHAFPESMGNLPVDHLADGVIFFYGFSQDEDFYNAFDKACTDLFTALGVTPDF